MMNRLDVEIPLHVAFDQFPVAKGELVIGGISLSLLAHRVGSTPFYAYDRAPIRARIAHLRRVFPEKLGLHYAVKANPMPALVGFMCPLVDGLDVASAGEMRLALNAGATGSNISFAGPAKQKHELLQAVAAGVLVNVESFREVTELGAISQRLGLPARISVRINPDFELKSAGMKMGGGSQQFGVDVEQMPSLMQHIQACSVCFEGFHIYCGSQNLNSEALCSAQTQSYDLALRLSDLTKVPLQSLNLGGGFGIPYFPGESRLKVEALGENLHLLVEKASRDMPSAKLALELGRFLVGEAGVYVTKIVDRKESRGRIFLVTDGGLHHHLAASGNFGQVIRKNYPVAIGTQMHKGAKEIVSVVGPLCTPLDVLADRVNMPHAAEGDLVVVFQSGAYGATASPQAFLGHPPCIEVVV